MTARPVELFIDPACPYAWMTSRWLHHAAAVRDITPVFSIMSLGVLNEGRDLEAGYRATTDKTWGAARVAIAILEEKGQQALSDWYTAWGEHYHVGENREDRRAAAVHALDAAGLPADLIHAYENVPGDAIDVALRASHARAIDMVGDDVGTPVISFGEGTAYFGPVISPAPRGEEAGRLLDGMEALASVTGFYEVKRTRSGDSIDFR